MSSPIRFRAGWGRDFVVCRAGMFQSEADMSEPIQWPAGEFTIQDAVQANPKLPEAVVREKLAQAIAAKAIVQTQKGDRKVKGKFQVVPPANLA